MKKLLLIITLFSIFSCSQKKNEIITAEVSCGQCQFGLKSQEGCDLAIRIDEKSYFVDGANIDDFGDAHDEHTGFCEVVRKGNVSGSIVNNRFQVSSIELIN
ncbi:DUF6370 family protein [Urechidicola croceus]|uniref:Uncharacterized protein n=1 Tax=Urechidicola croceus TaxID=1850246 RepID=A0A1D8P991_9FLAO|nr:DUF6370 family protein [Urechidicola croceus]AOW21127.1 hypothetical protein LPB138_10755 [Urechidicola croceus]